MDDVMEIRITQHDPATGPLPLWPDSVDAFYADAACTIRSDLTRRNCGYTCWPTPRSLTFPWYSSYGSDFNYDFHVTLDESVMPIEYNYRTKDEHHTAGTSVYVEGESSIEGPGLSCFLRDGDSVFHTYSTFARGIETVGGSHYFLDLTALGRLEDWEQPKGRATGDSGTPSASA
jgi:hypothetical protein